MGRRRSRRRVVGRYSRGRTSTAGSSALSIELENLRAALTWAVDRGEAGPRRSAVLARLRLVLPVQLDARLRARAAGRDRARGRRGGGPSRAGAHSLTLRSIDHLHHDRLQAAIRDAEAAVAAMDAGLRVLGVAVGGAAHGPRLRGHLGRASPIGATSACARPAPREATSSSPPRCCRPPRCSSVRTGSPKARACAEEAVVRRADGRGARRSIGVSTNLFAVMLFDEDPDRARTPATRGSRHLRSPVRSATCGGPRCCGWPASTTASTIPSGRGVPSLPRGRAAGRRSTGEHDPPRAVLPGAGRERPLRGRGRSCAGRCPPGTMVVGNVSDAEQRATEDRIRAAPR